MIPIHGNCAVSKFVHNLHAGPFRCLLFYSTNCKNYKKKIKIKTKKFCVALALPMSHLQSSTGSEQRVSCNQDNDLMEFLMSGFTHTSIHTQTPYRPCIPKDCYDSHFALMTTEKWPHIKLKYKKTKVTSSQIAVR